MFPNCRPVFRPQTLGVMLGVCALCGVLLAAKQFVQPAFHPAQAFAASDDHKDEQVAVALDPYDTQDKAQIFSVDYRSMGLLPVRLLITNDSDQPISLTQMKPTLVTVNRTKLSPLAPDDIFRRISRPEPTERKLPLPIPQGKKIKGGVKQQVHDEVEAAHFSAEAVEPHSTRAGFLFFDVQDISTPLAGAHFYLTGVRNEQGNELMYFEIPLEKYLTTAR